MTYYPVPYFLSSEGYGFWLDTTYRSEFKLAMHACAGRPAVLLKAVVARDDGDEGLVLRFVDMTQPMEARLTQIVEALPPLLFDRRITPGVVVSEVLEQEPTES